METAVKKLKLVSQTQVCPKCWTKGGQHILVTKYHERVYGCQKCRHTYAKIVGNRTEAQTVVKEGRY